MIQLKRTDGEPVDHEPGFASANVSLPRSQPSLFGKPVLFVCSMLVGLFAVWVVYLNLSQRDYPISPEVMTSSQEKEASQSSKDAAAESDKEPGQSQAIKPVTPLTGSTNASNQELQTEDTKRLPFTISLVYSPGYLINLGGLEKMHPFDIKKYQKIHKQLVADGLVTDEKTLKPSPLTVEDLELIHTKQYLDDLKDRKKIAAYLEAPVLAFAPVSLETAVLNPFLRASGGTLLAARESLKCGIGINIGGGYHHAKPRKGEGFCLYADVPIAIRKMQKEGLIKKALVIDVDVHQGNGTAVCLANDETTLTFSMHQGNIYPIPKAESDLDVELDGGMQDEEYLEVLEEYLADLFTESAPDICFIVGGCDTLSGDPLASLEMTPEGIVKRDAMIVKACRDRNVPVVLTLSGGYSPDAWKSQYMSIKSLIETYKMREQKAGDSKMESK